MRPSTSSQPSRLSRAAKAAQADNIRVLCRVRPLSKDEESKAATRELCVAFPDTTDDSSSVTCTVPTSTTSTSAINLGASLGHASTNPNDVHNFAFSHVFRPSTPQNDVYTDAGLPSVKDIMAGYNSTVFVYGQTGSGKTHTMFGRVHPHSARQATPFGALVKRKSSTNINGTSVVGGGGAGGVDGTGGSMSDINFFALRAAEGREADEADVFSPALPTFSQDDNDRRASARRGSADSAVTSASLARPSPPDTGRSFSSAVPTSASSDATSGIVPRAVRDIFTHIHSAPVTSEFEIRLFFVEVYMEQVRDLLSPEGHKTKLQVREDVEGRRFYVEDCEMPFVTSPGEVMHLVQAGLRRRATSATAMNETSSRSHCILNITVKSTDRRLHESRIGKLFLVDLAGSEKVSKTQSSGMRLEEAKLINRSLTSLSQVISTLSEGQRHIPYRDSVLTKILKDSLGGNARTSLIICCSPSTYNAPETLSTLRFGARAKTIKNRAVVNRQYSIEELETMLRVAREEIAELQKRLLQQQQQHPPSSSTPSPARAGATSSSGSAASLGAETLRPDGSSPPHAIRRLDTVAGITDRGPDGDDDLDRTADREDSDDELVMVSLRQRSREKMQLNDLLAEMGVVKDALNGAEETNAALSEERDTLRQRAACLAEECALWQDAHHAQRQRAAQRQHQLRHRDGVIATQQKEIHALIAQMEEWQEPLRVAMAAVEEATGEHRFGASVPRPRRRTLIALESPVPGALLARQAAGAGGDSTGSGASPLPSTVHGGGGGGARETDTVMLFPPPTAALSSLPPSHHASPTATQEGHADDFPLSPSARANQSVLARAEANRSARAGSVESPAMHPNAGGWLGRSPPPNTSPRMPEPLRVSRLVSEAALAEGAAPPDDATGASPPHAVDAGLSEAAAARIVELEHELAITQTEFDAIRQNYAGATLELQLSQKKLLIRQNRIESLKLSLQQECDTNKELRQTIENEHKGLRSLVQVARNDATYWQRRYEQVCASTGTPVTSSLDPMSSSALPGAAASDLTTSPVARRVAEEEKDITTTVSADNAHATSSKPREDSQKRAEGFNVFKSIFGGQKH